METVALKNPFKEILAFSKRKGPRRVTIDGKSFIILPDVGDDLIEELEHYLNDRLDRSDLKLRREIARRRASVRKGRILSFKAFRKSLHV
jgi:hypothetical protein